MVFLFAQAAPTVAAFAAGDITASITPPRNINYQVAIGSVVGGQEGISLTARFSEQSTNPVEGIHWSVYSPSGNLVYAGDAIEAGLLAPPGDYLVSFRYNDTTYRETLTVARDSYLSVSFILDIGAMRILPQVSGVEDAAVKAVNKVYALSGLDRGKLVATSDIPGESLILKAGEYRVESRIENGNTMVVSDVMVKSGVMSAVQINHKAGVARFSHPGVASTIVWRITSDVGTSMTFPAENALDVVLAPGHYAAEAEVDGHVYPTDFRIAPGETHYIKLEK